MPFGIDVEAAVTAWWEQEFADTLEHKYPGSYFVVLILQPVVEHKWQTPEAPASKLVELYRGEPTGEDLLANIHHKLRFALRTGLDSSEAQSNMHLVEPGDFPHGGAVIHRGFFGGASGLQEESDAWVTRKVIDKIAQIRAGAAENALKSSKAGEDWKYLPDRAPAVTT